MPTYMMLGQFTEQGIRNIEEYPERVRRFKEICQGEGAKVITYYLLMGKHDAMCIIEAPNSDVVAKIALLVGRRGNVRTQTFCAFGEKEMSDIVNKLPGE